MRQSHICTFGNHPPIRFWRELGPEEAPNKDYTPDRYISVVWDARQDFGHHTLEAYTCKSGKQVYFSSYNSGESYGIHEPRTRRTYLRDAKAIEAYFRQEDRTDVWFAICGQIDPAMIVDSDLL